MRSISQMQLKASLAFCCVTNQSLAFLANVVVPEVAHGQCAVDAQSVGNRCDALCSKSSSIIMDAAQLVT